jgi:hypothetical protein
LEASANFLSNDEWKRKYDNQYAPGEGNLHLILDEVSFGASMNASNFLSFSPPQSDNTNPLQRMVVTWSTSMNLEFQAQIELYSQVQFPMTAEQRVAMSFLNYTQHQSALGLPDLLLPDIRNITTANVGSGTASLGIYLDSWLPENFRIAYAYCDTGLERKGSMVQIALPFMVIVVICNAVKVIAIYLALYESYSYLIITQGDAISSFLERPDLTTVGKCSLDKEELLKLMETKDEKLKPWKQHKLTSQSHLRGRLMSNMYM